MIFDEYFEEQDDFDESEEIELCPKCKREEQEDWHYCPYQLDINNDRDSQCRCCSRCENKCRMDI